MGALINDPTRFEDDDNIRSPDRFDPMRDHHGRSPQEQAIEGHQYRLLGLSIETSRWLVEDHNRRILDQRARDRQSLPLTAGQGHAPLMDDGPVTVREGNDEVVDVGVPGSPGDVLVGGIRIAIGNVVADRASE